MSTSALVTIQQQVAALVPADRMDEFEQYKSLKPSEIVHVQPTTKKVTGVMPGLFVDRSTGEQFPKLGMILLSISEPRSKYPSAKFVHGEKPICRSYDGIVPITDNPELKPQSDTCATCEHSSWAKYDKKTREGKPTCKSSRIVFFINQDTGMVNYEVVNGTSVKTVDAMKESVMRAALGFSNKLRREAKAAGRDLKSVRKFELWDFVVDVESKPATDGPYHNFNPVKINPMSVEQSSEFDIARLALLARRAEYVAGIEAEEAAADANSATDSVAGENAADTTI